MKSIFVKILVFVLGLVALNILANRFFFRIDLTQEKRYSLSDASKKLLKNLDDDVYVKVYLTGDHLPSGFKRLENAIKETLDEFQVQAGSKINYRFIDINTEIKDEAKRNQFFAELQSKGIPPTEVFDKQAGQKIQTIVAPGAVLSYKGKEQTVLLLKGNKMASPQETLNQSYESVEYQLMSGIRELTRTQRKKIGFFLNYSSLASVNQIDLINSLKKSYDLFPVDIAQSPTLDGLDAIFVLKPDRAFSGSDVFKIDQFIVKGGKALFFIDALKVDSLAQEGSLAQANQLNLEDLLFKYGVRLNTNLVKDAQMCAAIPLVVGNMGNNPNIDLVPWPYYPLVNTFGKSPIVRNLDAVFTKYPGSIDTVQAKGIAKTPLLLTSRYTQVLQAPAVVSYNAARKNFDPKVFNQGSKMLGVLLEGKFNSLFSNQILPDDPRASLFKSQDKASKIIVVADGDIPTNDFSKRQNMPTPLGYDQYSGQTFANKDFVMNSVDYLLDENGVIAARNKEITLRPLDKLEITANRSYWQGINLGLPVLLILIIGMAYQWWRKKTYAS
jgi:gliding-associated putative ABC transporter substrate-binding component GldG